MADAVTCEEEDHQCTYRHEDNENRTKYIPRKEHEILLLSYHQDTTSRRQVVGGDIIGRAIRLHRSVFDVAFLHDGLDRLLVKLLGASYLLTFAVEYQDKELISVIRVFLIILDFFRILHQPLCQSYRRIDPVEVQVDAIDTHLPSLCVADRSDITAVHLSFNDIVEIGIRQIAVFCRSQLKAFLIPHPVEIVVLLRTYLLRIDMCTVCEIGIGLKPSSVLRIVVRLKSCKAPHQVRVQLEFFLQRLKNGLRTLQVGFHGIKVVLARCLHHLYDGVQPALDGTDHMFRAQLSFQP